jgi:hypothetical protein
MLRLLEVVLMSDKYITLMGAEQVQSAAGSMRSAAEQMSRAASQIDEVFARHQRFLDDWLVRFIDALDQKKSI